MLFRSQILMLGKAYVTTSVAGAPLDPMWTLRGLLLKNATHALLDALQKMLEALAALYGV